jgi:hypothetical protein
MTEFFVPYDNPDVVARTVFSDLDILQISSFLTYMNSKWSRVSRIYIVLRIIGQLQMIDTFIA